MLRISGCIILALGLAFLPLAAPAATPKVGVVDVVEFLDKSPEAKQAQEDLQKRAKEFQQELQPLFEAHDKMYEDYEKQKGKMKEEARKQREAELKQREKDLQGRIAKMNEEMNALNQKLMGPIEKKFQQAVEAVAKEMGLDVVLSKSSPDLVYFGPPVDITDKVRQRLGKK